MIIEFISATETSEPVSIAQVREYLRLTDTSDDAMLTVMIKTARKMLENFTGQALVPQVWRTISDKFKPGDHIWAPRVPIASVVVDVFSGGAFVVQSGVSASLTQGVATITDALSSPDYVYGGYRATFTSTRVAADAPSEFITAILELVSYWYDNRGDVGVQIPDKVRGLVSSYHVVHI